MHTYPKKLDTSQISLIVANLLPIFGVVFFDWDIVYIIYIYWAENFVIGFYTILKMIKSSNQTEYIHEDGMVEIYTPQQKNMLKYFSFFVIPFFILHFGGFSFGHGFIISILFGKPNITNFDFFVAIFLLFVSHGISFFTNFIKNKEYQRTIPIIEMFKPYTRIVIVHLTIILSALVTTWLKQPIWPLIVLIALKITLDLKMHEISHNKTKLYAKTQHATNSSLPN